MPLTEDAPITLFYAPRTRSFTILWLLEELERPYRIELVDMKVGEHRRPEALLRNPMGKLPVVLDGDVPVAETAAIATYLADKYAPGRLAPALDTRARAAYLRWMFFGPSVLEPALGEKFFEWKVPDTSVAWGSLERMQQALVAGLDPGPWLLEQAFTAADVIVGSGARFGVLFGALPKEGPIADYVARLSERPAFQRAREIEERYAAQVPTR
jgi:glutathione S-transferase